MKIFIGLIFLFSLLTGYELFSVKRSGCLTSPDMVPCLTDPCYDERKQGCGGYSTATCVPNYCGGCMAEWFVNGQLVFCDAGAFSSESPSFS